MKILFVISLFILSFSTMGQVDPRETPLGQAKCEAAKLAQQKLKRLYSINRIRNVQNCQIDSDCLYGMVGGLCPQPANIKSVATYQIYLESTAYKELESAIMKNCYVALPGCMGPGEVICEKNRCIGKQRTLPIAPRSIRDWR